MASVFGIISSLAVVTLGDALGRLDYLVQPTKIAAIEGLWEDSNAHSSAAAAPWLFFALPNDATQTSSAEIGIPYVLTPLITHSEGPSYPRSADPGTAGWPAHPERHQGDQRPAAIRADA